MSTATPRTLLSAPSSLKQFGPRAWQVRRFINPIRGALAHLMAHLKHRADGQLIHGPGGHLSHDCSSGGGGGCPCGALPACSFCPDATPSQFHVTFTGVSLCAGCVNCDALGVSLRLADGATINGTYTLTHNGACAWTAFSTSVPCAATLYSSTDCGGAGQAVSFAIQQVRISATQFRLQVTDDSNLVLLFDAIVTAAACCAAYATTSALTACGCGADGESINLAAGGSAAVTPC